MMKDLLWSVIAIVSDFIFYERPYEEWDDLIKQAMDKENKVGYWKSHLP